VSQTISLPLERDGIQKYLPHRPPMLMLDRVISFNENSIHAQLDVSADAFFFDGHFPGNPIMPGVMIVEAIAQAGALLALLNEHFDGSEYLMAFAGIENARFKRQVHPNETLCVFAQIVKQRRTLYKFEGKAMVGDLVVTKLNFSAVQAPKQE